MLGEDFQDVFYLEFLVLFFGIDCFSLIKFFGDNIFDVLFVGDVYYII